MDASLSVEDPPLELRVADHEKKQLANLACNICLQIVNSPMQCINGHLFCHACITRSMEYHGSTCPTCKTSLATISRNIFAEKFLKNVVVFCKYHFKLVDSRWQEDEEGCMDAVDNEKVAFHEKTCGYAKVSCKYAKECGLVRRRDLPQHVSAECPFRPVECPHCKTDVQYQLLEQHFSRCPEVLTKCSWCNSSFPRRQEQHHLDNICPLKPRECPFRSIGCPFSDRVVDEAMQEHLSRSLSTHMLLMQVDYQQKLVALTGKYESLIRDKDEKIERLKKDPPNETRVIWEIRDWKKASSEEFLSSKKFAAGTLRWYIGVYPKGDPAVAGASGNLSVYLFLDQASLTEPKAVTVSFSIKIVNTLNIAQSIKMTHETRFPVRGGEGWGESAMTSVDNLTEASGFVKNGVLRIEALLTFKRTTWHV